MKKRIILFVCLLALATGMRPRAALAAGADSLRLGVDELFRRTIEAMQSFAPDRDSFGGDEAAE